ncbi:Zinc finger C2H2 type [Paragonimus westermani]|uniref:Zinc finger C2H2 type n=1 Tax=Paragonimus westermani TaxID=34504 RepID=A0A8T0DNM3_9TREM|nr:Zinc finger C2H2 type [Paragonimus westermani]
MSADAIQNELCGILERLNALPPSERDDLLGFLKCFLSPLDGVGTSLPNSNSEYAVTHPDDSAVFVSSTNNVDPVSVDSNTVTSQDLNEPFILGDALNLGFFVQTQEKSTNTSSENSHLVISESQDEQPENIKSREKQEEPVSHSEIDHDSCCAPKRPTKTFPTSVLRCPVCWRGFSQWQPMESHLYKAHTTPVDPVCWRCQGVFDSHAVLLAHECFDWGRLHLPCQAILNGSSTTAKRQRALLANGSTFGYPADGIFLRRRCGLCFKSNVVFNNFQSFQL